MEISRTELVAKLAQIGQELTADDTQPMIDTARLMADFCTHAGNAFDLTPDEIKTLVYLVTRMK